MNEEQFRAFMEGKPSSAPKVIPANETPQEKRAREQKERMERQFSAVPYLIFIYVFQLLAVFVHSVIYLNN